MSHPIKTLQIFKKKSRIDAPVEEVFNWHARPGAIQRLSPPWDPLIVIRQHGGIQTGAEVVMTIKAGPVPIQWTAKHMDYVENRRFTDQQIKGPFSTWIHTHNFFPDGPHACFLEDQIEYALPFCGLTSQWMEAWIREKLERIFQYRHQTMISDISRHRSAGFQKPLKILISGASGLIGSSLVPFLTTGGHQVSRLVRKPPQRSDEIFWNPDWGVADREMLEGFDAVIHLAGENIGEGQWTREKKKKIVESRVNGTSTLVRAILKLKKPPKVFLCASAIGYYGNRGDHILTEQDPAGTDFVSHVCATWEAAAGGLMNSPIRTVLLRIGIVLSPSGGALKKLLTPFQFGLGGRISHGKQYMSWISMDDAIYAMHHLVSNERMEGPVNIVSPNPVTNADFSRTLGNVLSRPTAFTVPGKAIELFFGEMGRETILSSTRVIPDRLVNSGYSFSHPDLESALRHMLGKKVNASI
jgi:uncharacterized protein (TIGR01777 family)